jgi:heat-inducible transcriptional repressor
MKARQKKILSTVVREYQRTGQPVSSGILVQKYCLESSSATVRAEMLELDQNGFLEQPHTSAGRIPTDKAFRFFIEEIDEADLSHREKEQIWERLEKFHQESTQEVAQLLADCTRNLGISGLLGHLFDFHEVGWRWLADEPEFKIGDFKNILRYFDTLEENFNRSFGEVDEQIRIFIGNENPVKSLRQCSLILTGFESKEGRGVIGVLGPKRMNYHKNKFILEETKKRLRNK